MAQEAMSDHPTYAKKTATNQPAQRTRIVGLSDAMWRRCPVRSATTQVSATKLSASAAPVDRRITATA